MRVPITGHLSALDECIAEIFKAAGVIKLGFAFSGDLRELRRSYPSLRCFDVCQPVIDGTFLLRLREKVANRTAAKTNMTNTTNMGLSELCRLLLGAGALPYLWPGVTRPKHDTHRVASAGAETRQLDTRRVDY